VTKARETTSLRHLQVLSKELEVPKVLDEKQEDYLAWLMLPRNMREPATKAQLAEVLGTTVSSLKRWDQLPHFKEAYRKLVSESIATPERVIEAANVAWEMGFGPNRDIKWATLFAQMGGLTKVDAALKPSAAEAVADLSDEELDALLFDAAAAEKARRAKGG
jgi:hypothetical protein